MTARRCINELRNPKKLWRISEALERGSSLPAKPGIYGWLFRGLPAIVPTRKCATIRGWKLAYVGIAPSRHGGAQSLRRRIRTHARGNASGSTLRYTLGCLLGIPLCLQPSGRLTFGPREAELCT